MLSIHLHNLHFFSFHGLHEEEAVLGNEYEVNLAVSFQPRNFPVRELEETLDYTKLYKLVKLRMAQPTPLLETIATEIVEAIRSQHSQVQKISISIKKLYPPINNFEGAVGVSFEWNKRSQ